LARTRDDEWFDVYLICFEGAKKVHACMGEQGMVHNGVLETLDAMYQLRVFMFTVALRM
jgi:hypothetical protein